MVQQIQERGVVLMYRLILKSTKEQIDRIKAGGLEEAKSFYIARKQMDEKTFNKMFEVVED